MTVGTFKILDRWEDGDGGEVYIAEVELDGSERVTVEYYENMGGARIDFWWQQVK